MSGSSPNLLDLPDDIILIILNDLSSHDIVNCSFVCNRLDRICRDHTLWINADFIDGGHELTTSQAELAIEFLCSRTTSLYMRAVSRPEQLFSKRLLRKVLRTCPDLRTLALENWNLELTVRDFPAKLWRLSIADSRPAEAPESIPGRRKRKHQNCCSSALTPNQQFKKRSYFFGIFLAIPRLQSLDLSRCHWLDNHSLLALSKCQHLRELSINGCSKMGGCVAYSALAAGMGFSALERLDVRDTNMEDIDLKNFLSKPTIEQIFVGRNMELPDPRVPFTDKELEEWDSAQEWPRNITFESLEDIGISEDITPSSEEDCPRPPPYFGSSDSDDCEPPSKMERRDSDEASTEQSSTLETATTSKCVFDSPPSPKSSTDENLKLKDASLSNVSGPSGSLSSQCSTDAKKSDSAVSSNCSIPPVLDEQDLKDNEAQPEKTRQIVAILETIRRVDNNSPRVDGGITVQIRASRRDIEDMQAQRGGGENEGIARNVVLELLRPPDSAEREEAEAAAEAEAAEAAAAAAEPLVPQAGPSSRHEGNRRCSRLPKRRQLAMSLKGKVWSPWQHFNEDTVEPRRFRVGRDAGDGEDFEEYLEEDGRNVIVLNCMNEGIHRTTHVYTKLDFPKISKKAKPGAFVTDDLVRYPLQCKKLQVLSLGGCKNVTDVFLTFLVRHDLNYLRLLDVRDTGVTDIGVTNLQSYMGNSIQVLYSE